MQFFCSVTKGNKLIRKARAWSCEFVELECEVFHAAKAVDLVFQGLDFIVKTFRKDAGDFMGAQPDGPSVPDEYRRVGRVCLLLLLVILGTVH